VEINGVLVTKMHYSGGKFKVPAPDFYYLSGGAGYTISRSTLKALVEQVLLPVCEPDLIVSFEDLMVSNCLWAHLGVKGYDARDSNRSYYRYHSFAPEFMSQPGNSSDRMGKKFRNQNRVFMKKHYNFSYLYSLDAISQESIGFHKIQQPLLHYRMYELLYHGDPANSDLCKNKSN
jgi:hypothetical protein